MITVVIIVILFSVQSRGTESIGKVFGSMVLVWFASSPSWRHESL